MNIYTFDFDEIDSQEDFWHEFSRTFELERGKVTDLDSLWDVIISGGLPLQLFFRFIKQQNQSAKSPT